MSKHPFFRLVSHVFCLIVLLTPLMAGAVALDNPLGGGVDNIADLIGRTIKSVLGLSGVGALLMFVWGGMQWVLSAGEEKAVLKGKKTIIWASLGLAIIFFSYAIASAVTKFITTGSAA